MAADILLYKSTHVPVGEDQKQHLELSRDITQEAFNRYYNLNFSYSRACYNGKATRLYSLKDGFKKMSKSDPSDQSRVNLTDEPEIIRKKIQKTKQTRYHFQNKIEDLKSRSRECI